MNFSNLWSEAMPLLKKSIGESSFELWMKYVKPLEIVDNEYRFAVPNSIIQNIVRERFKPIIEETLSDLTNMSITAVFIHDDSLYGENSKISKPKPKSEHKITYSSLNQKYTFENFVVGGGNQLAHSAAISVYENPGENYNPFFIYGGVGLGKTHLMQAIGNASIKKNPNKKVIYVSGEMFTNELINAIRDGSTEEFRKKYREIDLLLIDDIQFLAGKVKTEEEFFHTFNSLHQNNKQIVITSDKPPKEIGNLENRLISRFASGLTADIQPPDMETRVAILQKKRHAENLPVSDEILQYIAKNIKSNVRELEGAMIQVNANQALVGKEANLEEAMEILRDVIDKREKNLTPEMIKKYVCKLYQVSIEDLNSQKRLKSIAEARQIAMYLIRELTDISIIKVGESFFRHHSTVIHAVEKIEKLIEEDEDFGREIRRMKKYLTEDFG